MMDVVAAFSGGRDSTAMVLQLEPKAVLFTTTDNELPPVLEHVQRIADLVGAKVIRPNAPTLAGLIAHFNAVPNPRMRWCTRMIKVLPCIAWMHCHPRSIIGVGLRADEEERDGIYGLPAERYVMPLREWGWGKREVDHCLRLHGVDVPDRTDCAVCPYQRLGEWWRLWHDWPEYWAQGEKWERETRHTFRMASRDTWPASMEGLRLEFEQKRLPRGWHDVDSRGKRCRVCTL